jgi:hypothetical protein
MARSRPRRLVIDACVIGRANEHTDEPSYLCALFLSAVREVGCRAVLTPELLDEWHRHMSFFSEQWLIRMFGEKRIARVPVPPDERLRAAVEQVAPDPAAAAAMLKDCHLIEAARASDRNVVSIDEEARGYFHGAAGRVGLLREVCWVNPAVEDEQPLDWLHQGAPRDRHRRLGSAAGRGG